MVKKDNISTSSNELYQKLNMLNLTREVLVQNVSENRIKKILSNINKKNNVITMEKIGNYFLLRRVNPINYNIYLKR